MIFLIGSLRNEGIPDLGRTLREATGQEVFEDWHAAGPKADDHWRDYEMRRGRSFKEALRSPFAGHAYRFDREWLTRAENVVLALPAGRSGHLELGWALGKGKRGYVLLDPQVDRWDMMYQYATDVCESVEELVACLKSV